MHWTLRKEVAVEWHTPLGKIELALTWEAPRCMTKVRAIKLPRPPLYNVSLGAIRTQNWGKKG